MLHALTNVDISAIIAAEACDAAEFAQLPMRRRGDLLISACQAAAALEESRLKMGLPPTEPAPWPSTTWTFLASAAAKLKAGSSR
jgi:hypothetical protein